MVRSVRGRWFLFLAVAVGLVANGCGQPQPKKSGDGTAGRKLKIGMVPKGANHVFWQSVRFGATKAADELGIELSWRAPRGEDDISGQSAIVENLVIEDYDGICLAPVDATALRKPVDKALKKEIPVVIFDSALADSSGIVSYVATDNYQSGFAGGEKLAELLGGKGKVVLLRYEKGSESTDRREQGFTDAIAKYPEIKIISDNVFAGATEDSAIPKAEGLVENFGDEVDGIFCPNESSTGGMLTALTRLKKDRLGEIKFVGFDAGNKINEALEKKILHATVLQDPVTMGYESVKAMHRHLNKQAVDKEIKVKGGLATPENRETPEIKNLLKPPILK